MHDRRYRAPLARETPAVPTIWTFVAADTAGFGALFLVFMIERAAQRHLFEQSAQLLDVRIGLANTLILISSSWLVALAVLAAEEGRGRSARRLLTGGIAVGAAFGALKLWEYTEKFSHDITPFTNDFFTYYFVLTGVHFVHLIGGLLAMSFIAPTLTRRPVVDERTMYWLRSAGIYWHMVDLLWVFLFPLLYLQKGFT
jgi:nitric oxide reductase NorE protein